MARLFACAIVHGEPPEVFAAEDQETLNWVLALRLVASEDGSSLPEHVRDNLRDALLEERWGDAVVAWIEHFGAAVDVYPSMELFTPTDIELAPLELQFRPLFRD